MKKALLRILNKDIKSVENLQDIKVNFDENDMFNAQAYIIGPVGTIYENSILLFSIHFPKNYPFAPPNVLYKPINNIRIHPNLYQNGKVCLSFLGTWSGPGWTSVMDISSILLSIQSLLCENPLRNEPGYENIKGTLNENYNIVIQYNSINSLIIDSYNNLPEIYNYFKEDFKKHIIEKKEYILKKINDNINIDNNIKLSIYGINENVNYLKLKKKYLEFISSIDDSSTNKN
jgi:ubiquitin-protein ligase